MDEQAPPPLSRTQRIVLLLDRSADKPWFMPAVGAFPLMDYALPFLPNQILMISLSFLKPDRWRMIGIAFVAASALGAFLAALFVQAVDMAWLNDALGGVGESGTARTVGRMVSDYGVFALVALALLPVPPRAAVLVCAMAGIAPWLIGASVAAGRVFPVFITTYLASRAPEYLMRWSYFRSIFGFLQHRRMQT